MELLLLIIVVVLFWLFAGNNNNSSTYQKPSTRTYQPNTPPKTTPKTKPKTTNNKQTKQYQNNTYGLIQRCIDTKKDIHFTYQREDGDISSRRVTPEVIYWGNSQRLGDGHNTIRTCYIEAYCHLRHEDRTFILDRMSNVQEVTN